jgi:hypothetical protein
MMSFLALSINSRSANHREYRAVYEANARRRLAEQFDVVGHAGLKLTVWPAVRLIIWLSFPAINPVFASG